MEDVKFTPGPWNVRHLQFLPGEPIQGFAIWPTDKDRLAPLASIGVYTGNVSSASQYTAAEFEANGYLLASSPDLYRELRHLVRLLEPVEYQLNVPGLATLNGARAAIAKAEGR